jgi:type II secretory pathway component PulC
MLATRMPTVSPLHHSRALLVTSGLLLALAACASGRTGQREHTAARVGEAPTAAATQRSSAPPHRPPAAAASVGRAELQRLLDAGPGQFLQSVQVKAFFYGGRFTGWEIVRLTANRLDLRPGDVVSTVNDHTIERPEQLARLWEDLRAARTIVIRGFRRGQPLELRVAVQD